jgi:hypothetical protein
MEFLVEFNVNAPDGTPSSEIEEPQTLRRSPPPSS